MPACIALEDPEVFEFLDSFSGRYADRNRAMALLHLCTGFRRHEILSLRLGDVLNPDGSIVNIIHVKAENMKGSKRSRSVPLCQLGQQALREWIEILTTKYEMRLKDDALWPKPDGRPLKDNGMHECYKKAFRAMGKDKHYATHTMRKTFAQYIYIDLHEMYWNRELPVEPIIALQAILGHKDIRSTQQYIKSFTETPEVVKAVGTRWQQNTTPRSLLLRRR